MSCKYLLLLLILLISCSTKEKEPQYKKIVDEYYAIYQKRQDFEKFLSYYSKDIVLEDMVNGDRILGIENLKEFLDWENPNFTLQDSVALIINQQFIQNNTVLTQGYFTPFTWSETSVEAMQFSTTLTLNEQGKIIHQIDWINYPSNVVDYSKRKNSNDWIKAQ